MGPALAVETGKGRYSSFYRILKLSKSATLAITVGFERLTLLSDDFGFAR